MNCSLAHDLLQQSLDGTSISSPEWEAHLRQCADCRALASASRRLQEGLRRLTVPLPPPDLGRRIAERVPIERRRTRRRWTVGVALAAGLFLALILRFVWHTPTIRLDVSPVEPVAKNAPATPSPWPSPPEGGEGGVRGPVPTLRESAAELGEVFADLTTHTAEETVGQTRHWVANVPRPAMPNVDLTAMEAPSRPLREAGEGVSEGLEPVTTSARRAVGLFLRELPPMETEPNGL